MTLTNPAIRGGAIRIRSRSRGFVLLLVLVIVMLASMVSLSLLFSLRADVTAQTAGAGQEQAWAAALSGVARAMVVARAAPADLPTWADQAGVFQHQGVVPDGDDTWYFSVYGSPDSFSGAVRYGLDDENGKLPLLEAPPAWLSRLPGVDEAAVGSLVSTSAPSGPGNTTVPAPTTSAASRPEITLEEACVRAGIPTSLLVGEDTNSNLRLDPNEDDADASPPLDDRNGVLDPGLQRLLTVTSYDLNVDTEGRPRLDLNDPNADLSGVGLPQATLDYLAALRRAQRRINHPVDLLGAKETLPNANGANTPFESGIGPDELPTLLDRCTATTAPRLFGLINLNTAPAPVLAAIPTLGETGADTIVASRTGLSAEERRTPAWILRRGLVTADQFKEIAPRLTTRSYQFSFRSIGYAVPSGRFRVLAVTIDVATQPARILALRDLTRFGFPIPLGLLQGETP